jgi:hypothetical protein
LYFLSENILITFCFDIEIHLNFNPCENYKVNLE